MLKNEQKFYSALEDVFIGEAGKKIEGKSGFVNLMKIKSQYFAKIKPYIQKEVAEKIKDDKEREELYQKLYTFFESYLNETGTPFFSQTPFYKNLYEKVYSEREDVSLFWKTQRLYYVKSEATYATVNNLEVDELLFDFDASNIEHKKSNEKKELEFYLTDATNEKLTFKVLYADNSRAKYDKIKEYLGQDSPDAVRKFIAENDGKVKHPNIKIVKNNLKREGLKTKTLQDALLLFNNEDAINTVTIEFAISKIDDMLAYADVNNLYKVTEDGLKKAFAVYKKQNEVDYFIHKDAEAFLKEQFDLFMYQQLFGDNNLYNEWKVERIEYVQKIKQLAYKVIEYIAKFEEELKAIWNKPKFVRNSNYVLTLDKLENNVDLIKKIIKHPGWKKQIEEWKELSLSNVLEENKIIDDKGKLNKKYKYLPIDTKYFKNIDYDILESFENIDKTIDGILIKSDNYQALITIKEKYNRAVKTIYIDPPFNKENEADYEYIVKYKDSTWNTILENRIEVSKNFLNNFGSIFVRCDYNGNYLVREILDKILDKQNFRNEIVVNRFKRQLDELKRLNFATETLFYYAKSDEHTPNKKYRHRSCTFCGREVEPSWRPMSSPGVRWSAIDEKYIKKFSKKNVVERNDKFVTQARIIDGIEMLPPKRRHWTFTQERIEQLEKEKRIRINTEIGFTDQIGVKHPGLPEYLQTEDTPIDTSWNDLKGYAFGTDFSTENAEELLQRVIEFSSNENELVADYFLGSGTTIAVAQKIKRRWLGVEIGEHFDTYILPRMKRVLAGEKSQISKDVNWQGGGFFKYYELEQYEEALSRAKYNPREGDLSNINFSKEEKLLDAMVIDEEKEEVKIHFELLYPDVDIAETISNITGKKIKKLNKERVIFEDDTIIEFANMNYYDPIFKDAYRSLLWWKSKE